MQSNNGKIKVALMSYAMDNRKSSGTASYAQKMIEGLLADPRFDVYLVHYDRVDDPLYKKAKEIIMPEIKLPYATRFIRQLLFFWKYRKNKFDIIHWFQPRLYPFFWLAPAKKIIVTIHGAGMVSFPSPFNFPNKFFNFVLMNFNKWIDVIIASSEYGKEEIIQYYRAKPEKVRVTYLGGGEEYKVVEKLAVQKLVIGKYKISVPFILDVSRLTHHKNVDSLIKAYIVYRDKYKGCEKLVIVGSPLFDYQKTYDLASNSEYKDDIYFIDFVKQEDLNAMYSAAELFVFPSLNEGFGLPVIEAMASGTPVITSNTTSLPEVAGDAAILIDPLNIEAMAEKINEVLSNNNLKNELIKKGLERSKKFTWARTVDKVKEIYLNLARNGLCPICRQNSVLVYQESYFDNNQEYKLYECFGCGVQFWEPFKNPGAEWYEKDERYASRNIDPDLKPYWNHKKIINYLRPFAGSVLDVGCGTGNFLYWAKKNSWQVFGIDFDRDAIGVAQKTFGLKNVEVNDLTNYYKKYPDRKFDLITFFEVWEHLDNPNDFLDTAKKMLKDKGYIAASMPCRDMANWLNPYDLPPRHLTKWNKKSLKNFLERHSFKVLYLKRKTVSLKHILMKIRFRYGKYFSFNLVGKLKKSKRTPGEIILNSDAEKKIVRVHTLARIKDWILFGLPALIVWLAMLPTSKRYITLYIIAQIR